MLALFATHLAHGMVDSVEHTVDAATRVASANGSGVAVALVDQRSILKNGSANNLAALLVLAAARGGQQTHTVLGDKLLHTLASATSAASGTALDGVMRAGMAARVAARDLAQLAVLLAHLSLRATKASRVAALASLGDALALTTTNAADLLVQLVQLAMGTRLLTVHAGMTTVATSMTTVTTGMTTVMTGMAPVVAGAAGVVAMHVAMMRVASTVMGQTLMETGLASAQAAAAGRSLAGSHALARAAQSALQMRMRRR